MDIGAVNWLAVLVAVVTGQALGFVWYGPLFGKMWLNAIGRTQEELGSGTQAIIIASIGALVMSVALALLLTVPERVDLVTGVTFGALTAIGFVATTTVINGVFEDRRPTVMALFAAYETVSLIVMGAILGAWR